MENLPLYLQSDLKSKPEFLNFSQFEKDASLSLRQKGYFIIKDLIDNKLIDAVIEDCKDRYKSDGNYDNENNRILDAFTFSDNVKKVATNKKVVALLTSIYGSQSFPFQTLNFEYGTEQKLHSDMIHFSSFPKFFMAGCWVAFEDVTLENGPLQYIDDSHFLPDVIPQEIEGYKVDKNDPYKNYSLFYEPYIEKLINNLNLKKSYAVIKKGDAFIWSANLIHGGSVIKNKERTRLSQVTHYYFKNCVYYTPLLSDTYNSQYEIRYPWNILTMKKLHEKEVFNNAKILNLKLNIFNWSNFLLSKPLLVRKFLALINLLTKGKLRSHLENKIGY